jgi:transposase
MSENQSSLPPVLPQSIDESNQLLVRYYQENQYLKHELANLKKMIFGQKSERFVPAVPEEQMSLEGLFETAGTKIPGFAESKETIPRPGSVTISYERRKPKQGHGRKPIPDDLHREKQIIEPTPEEKTCSSCGAEKKKIGEDITEELEYKPAVFFVNQFVRPKYACPCCPDNGVTTAALPDRPIDKGIAGPGLLSYIIVSKHVDHLPLYRLEQMFKRYNIHINRSTMCGWLKQVEFSLQAIHREMHRQLLCESFLIQADETTLKVLDESVKDQCALGYLWPYVGDGKLAVFEFQDSRARSGPTDFLKLYTGRYLLSDGYAGYNQVVEKKDLVHLMCWAHARRKFFEVKDLDPPFVDRVLTLIGKLYDVEREAAEQKLSPDKRGELRQKKSVPVLAAVKELLFNPGNATILPKNKISEAVAYTLNHWDQLTNFLEDGRLPIDNNLVENAIRPIALGRKNWLFAGSPDGAQRLATFYSLVATCKLNNINPYEYFVDILPKVASHPSNKIAELTPAQWKMSKNSP